MTVLIEDAELVQRLEHIAADTGISVDKVVGDTLKHILIPEEVASRRRRSPEEVKEAFYRLQEAYAAGRNPIDNLTADQIIGYNEHGHFD